MSLARAGALVVTTTSPGIVWRTRTTASPDASGCTTYPSSSRVSRSLSTTPPAVTTTGRETRRSVSVASVSNVVHATRSVAYSTWLTTDVDRSR